MADGTHDPNQSGFVNYDEAAKHYDAGRALSDPALERWRDAALAQIAREPAGRVGKVLDLGCGTGLFISAWKEWGATTVVGVEPSSSMRAKATARVGAGTHIVAGSAECIPLATQSIDVVWMSAVLHHVTDIEAASAEIARVLRPTGHLLIRGFFPDRSVVAWLDALPGAERAKARFPSTEDTARVFAAAGLAVRDVVEIEEPLHHHGSVAADWVEMMRHSDSLLTALTDEEIATGVARLRQTASSELPATALTLMAFDRSHGHRG